MCIWVSQKANRMRGYNFPDSNSLQPDNFPRMNSIWYKIYQGVRLYESAISELLYLFVSLSLFIFHRLNQTELSWIRSKNRCISLVAHLTFPNVAIVYIIWNVWEIWDASFVFKPHAYCTIAYSKHRRSHTLHTHTDAPCICRGLSFI